MKLDTQSLRIAGLVHIESNDAREKARKKGRSGKHSMWMAAILVGIVAANNFDDVIYLSIGFHHSHWIFFVDAFPTGHIQYDDNNTFPLALNVVGCDSVIQIIKKLDWECEEN